MALSEKEFLNNDVTATGRSLVQRSPTEYGVSECDPESFARVGQGPLGLSRCKKKK
jgi:hypothetical protein